MSGQPAAGWYQRPLAPEEDRYWDGAQWTDQVRPHVVPPDQEPPPQDARSASAPMHSDPSPSYVARSPVGEPAVSQYTAAAAGAVQRALGSDVVKQRRGELFVAGGNVLLLIALIMPWFHLNVDGANVPGSSVNAFETRGLMYLVLITLLATVAYIVSRVGWGSERSRPTSWRILLAATGLNLALSLFCFLAVPGGRGVSSNTFGVELSEKYQWSYGGFIGVAAAIIAFSGALRVRKERKHAEQDSAARVPLTG
jgi:Protein of unknown function (DUF2510)